MDEESFTELFVRVCAHPKLDDIVASERNIKSAVNFLIDKKKDTSSACGLLRIIYNNNICLTSFPTQSLLKFEQFYQKDILRFFRGLSSLPKQLVDIIPATMFCFTRPILNAIRE